MEETGNITIRPATVDDVPHILRLWRELMDYHAARDRIFTVPPDGPENCQAWIEHNIQSDRSLVLVAESTCAVVGYCIAVITPYPPVLALKEYCEIYDLAVTEAHRRRGVGEALFERVKAWCREKAIQRIEAKVAVTNDLSTRFWRKMGLSPYMEIMHYDLKEQG